MQVTNVPSPRGSGERDRLRGDSGPWYKHKWPWLIALPPAISVVAGIALVWIAATQGDTLVAEDYYRRGVEMSDALVPARNAMRGQIAPAAPEREAP